jgi:hypothetical protein
MCARIVTWEIGGLVREVDVDIDLARASLIDFHDQLLASLDILEHDDDAIYLHGSFLAGSAALQNLLAEPAKPLQGLRRDLPIRLQGRPCTV